MCHKLKLAARVSRESETIIEQKVVLKEYRVM